MSYEGIIAIAAMLLSIVVGIGGLKKGKADTYSVYQDAINKAQDNYDQLTLRFDTLEKKYYELSGKYEDMVLWNKALVNQLVASRITPITLSQAKKYCAEANKEGK